MADIVITDLTNGNITTNTDSEYVWTGTGIFDKLIEAVNSNIKIQFDEGRIKDSDYANVYLGSMQSVIAQSMQYLLQEKVVEADIALKEKQLEKIDEEIDLLQTQDASEQVNRYNAGDKMLAEAVTKYGYLGATISTDGKVTLGTRSTTEGSTNKQDDVLEAQKYLYTRQTEGFDDNKNQKLFEAQLNSWALMYSSGLLTEIPDIISTDETSAIYNTLKPQ